MLHSLLAAMLTAAAAAMAESPPSQAEASNVDDLPRSQRAPSVTCSKASQIIRLSSADMAEGAGLAYATVAAAPMRHSITRTARISYNANRFARLSSRAAGVIAELPVDLGDRVAAGDVLAVVDSVDLGQAKASLLQSVELVRLRQRHLERKRMLMDSGVGIERELFEAESSFAESRITLDASRQKLRNLGLTSAQIEAIESDRDTSSLLQITAPFDGNVVDRSGAIGETVDQAQVIISIADTSTVWAMIDLQESDIGLLASGQRAIVTPDGLRARTFPGIVNWISSEVDPRTRVIKARAVIPNGDGLLRANMFGRAEIVTRDGEPVTFVPRSAVQWEGCCNVVFTRDESDPAVFRPRKVTLGFESGDAYEVLDGLEAGDVVVTDGSFVLKTELMKSSIGAGCCEVEHLAE